MFSRAAQITAVPLPPNPVWRSYAGGSVLRRFRGVSDTADDHFPEDWLASIVRARNGVHSQSPDEGLSQLGGGTALRTVAEAIGADPGHWFGSRNAFRTSTGVLWKLLDSSVRLQFQAHPDAEFARKRLNSDAGKTECWYILGTRGDACVYLGFQRPPARDDWSRMIREQSVDEMLDCFDPIPVKSGDCFVVPAGVPHAIGAGVFMVELMEPTDWVVRCERVNAGVTLSPEACFMGLNLEDCLDIFDYRAWSSADVRATFLQRPRTVCRTDSFMEQEIIGAPWHEYFRLNRVRGTGSAHWAGDELMLLICVNGEGSLAAGSKPRDVRAGETWLLPGAAESWEWSARSDEWELLLAKLPVVSQSTSH